MSRNVWIIIGVIASIVIAWILVDVAFSVLWFIVKLAIVAVVAVIVFFVLRSLIGRSGERKSIER
jgi:membrane protein YdbS with pleckstrin-like domain